MKEIDGYENKYGVDEEGNVYSLNYNNTKKCVVLKFRLNRQGRPYVNLCLNGKYTSKLIHRLVAETYLMESYQEGFEVNHKDGNKQNNALPNLEWTTNEGNRIHAVELGLHLRGVDNPSSKLTESEVLSIRSKHKAGTSMRSLAKIYDCNCSTIRKIVNRVLWKHL